MKLLSIVTACYNESENIEPLIARVREVLASLPQYDYEIIAIDNASTDGTQDILRRLAADDTRLKVILNARNFGYIRSPYHGFLQASGDAVICMVSDFQDPPDMIPRLVEQWERGYKAVVGVKNRSEESKVIFFLRTCYYRLLQRLAEIETIENFTGFGLYDRAIVAYCRELKDPYPYFRGIISEIGLPTTKILFVQPARRRGLTKGNFYKLYDVAMLGVTNHTKVPLRCATMTGFVLAFLSLLAGFVYLVYKLLFWDWFTVGTAPVVIGLFFFSSVQLLFIGILGEYVGAIQTQILKRPLVVERERINF